ncbi:MAG: hypothetical protein D6734_08075 [Candidatus Schekmanbacteria bacterium]|nr:MAG: hypothetical protein D6734_08075 [Candidatus Schekmanbacteria bacterium]
MAKNTAENKLSKELRSKLNEKDKIGILSAVDTNSVPNMTLIVFFISKDEESILFAIDKENPCYKNLVKNKKVVFGIYDNDNFCYKIVGRAGVVKAPSDTHPMMNIVRLDVITIQEETFPYMRVTNGIAIEYLDAKTTRFGNAMFKELKKVAAEL